MALKIREFRKINNLSQKELAEKLFVTAQAVSKWEKGLSMPNPDTLVKIAEIFACSTDDLLGLSQHEESDAIQEKELADQTQGFIKLFEMLPSDKQDFVIAAMKGMITEE